MGTNYYHRINICETCGRYDEHHIGKSSGGWTFSFHGQRDDDPDGLLGGKVVSIGDWRQRLKFGPIFDEYGRHVDTEDFWELVEKKKDGKNHTEYCRKEHPRFYIQTCWLDDEGNSFSEGEFS